MEVIFYMEIKVHKDHSWRQWYKENEHHPSNSNWDLFSLYYKMQQKRIHKTMDQLESINYIKNVTMLPHQKEVCDKVLFSMNGRAILADEVGLGKTIEACFIMKELLVRKMAKKILIIVPASLIYQWEKELRLKFFIYPTVYKKINSSDLDDIVLCSYEQVKRNRKVFEQHCFDLLIIDEAHKVVNPKTINYQMVQQINKKYCLLLTATPMKNTLDDIYYLIQIVQPTLFADIHSFRQLYKSSQSVFRERLSRVLIRNQRQDHIDFIPGRNIETKFIYFTEEEQVVYDQLKKKMIQSRTPHWVYLKQFCSSREACYLSLQKNEPSEKQLLSDIASLPHHIKAKVLIDLFQSIKDEKVVIFTQYKPSQYYIQWYLQQHGINSVAFSGDLSQSNKQWIVEQFKNDKQVLVATDACSEGINLHFAHILINYDLPWNPMRLEQRIGRIHRFGQKNDVRMIHLVLEHTIEAHILRVIYKKINVFQESIGGMDKLLEQKMNEYMVDS